LVRRPTGGGAVFHDEGNSNFTFWEATPAGHPRSPLHDPLIQQHFAIIQQALRRWQISAVVYGRNDLGIDDGGQRRKISGNAFTYHPTKVLHHGTLLRAVHAQKMATYLRPHPLKLKGVASCPQRVVGLNDYAPTITHQNLGEAILAAWLAEYGKSLTAAAREKIVWQHYSEADLPALLAAGDDFPYQKWRRPEWNWGTAIQFAQKLDFKFSFGLFTIMAKVGGDQRVEQAIIYSDALNLDLVPAWQQALPGCLWRPAALLACFPVAFLPVAAQAEVAAALAAPSGGAAEEA
jgi:lipoate-protein ligase A